MSEIWDRMNFVTTFRTIRPLWADRTEAVFARLRTNSFGKTYLSATLTRLRDTTALLGPAGRGAARLVMERALATPKRFYIGAGVAALVVGIGAAALFMQHAPHPAPLLGSTSQDASRAVATAASPAGTAEPVAVASVAPAAQPPAASESPAAQASAPDTTASIEAPPQAKQHQSSASSAPDGGRRVASLTPDPIGALLRGKTVDDGSHLVREAQVALLKLGYAVKPNGAEDGATRRALRRFERAHGLARRSEINAELVRRLTAAAKP